MLRYVVLEKMVGETPLSCAEAWRVENPQYAGVPLAYAGRLDPMASGKLLVLIGDECKNQINYHDLDKAYDFSILLGVASDTLDVLGRLKTTAVVPTVTSEHVGDVVATLVGDIELPYPKFSAKTVHGKPLHMWTLENRLDEITIPTKQSVIYSLKLDSIETVIKADLVERALTKVNSIPVVTDPRKALGNDFRRADVRADWNTIAHSDILPAEYTILNLTCIASSGTYMRTLASIIADKLGTVGLAFTIHRTHIGTYDETIESWTTLYT